jgi:hypothetical protein
LITPLAGLGCCDFAIFIPLHGMLTYYALAGLGVIIPPCSQETILVDDPTWPKKTVLKNNS